MAQSGIGASGVGFDEESVCGTQETTLALKWLDSRGGMESVAQTIDQIVGQDLGQFGALQESLGKGFTSVAGSLDFDLRFGGGWLIFLSHLLGKAPVTTGSNPYTHTQALGADPVTSQMAKGITLAVGKDGISGGNFDWIYSGIRPTSMTFNFPENGIATCSCSLIGQAEDAFVAAATPAYSSEPYIKSPTDATSPSAQFLSFGGTSYVCKSASVSVNVPWELRRDLQATEGLVPALAGQLELTASFEVETPATASDGNAFDIAYAAQTLDQAAVFTLEGGTTADRSLVISLGQSIITTAPTPHVSGPELQTMSVDIKAYGKADGTNEGSFVLINTDSSAW